MDEKRGGKKSYYKGGSKKRMVSELWEAVAMHIVEFKAKTGMVAESGQSEMLDNGTRNCASTQKKTQQEVTIETKCYTCTRREEHKTWRRRKCIRNRRHSRDRGITSDI